MTYSRLSWVSITTWKGRFTVDPYIFHSTGMLWDAIERDTCFAGVAVIVFHIQSKANLSYIFAGTKN